MLRLTAALLSTLVAPMAAQSDEQQIREARARSNAAIAAHDIDGIAAVWMEDVHVVTSTGTGAVGRCVNRARFADQFRNRPDVIYVRTPESIQIFEPWGVASERGTWQGSWTQQDGVTRIGGNYQVQWRKIDGVWLIQAELYVPTECSGSSWCREHP